MKFLKPFNPNTGKPAIGTIEVLEAKSFFDKPLAENTEAGYNGKTEYLDNTQKTKRNEKNQLEYELVDEDGDTWYSEAVPVFSEIRNDDDLMSLEDFEGSCLGGGFIDYDGYGNLATKDKKSDIEIYPSLIKNNTVKIPEWATHVVWYNR